MAKYNVHAGHCPQGKGASGAVGILKESVEDRLVKNEVIRILRAEGHTAYDCTCEDAVDQDTCLDRIIAKCNSHNVDYDVSIHLNSGRNDYKGDKSTGGTEVWNYDEKTKAISDRICANISKQLGMRNRGTKYDKGLKVLNSTKAKAMLVECCFVDDKDDADKWDYKKCAKAIVEGLTGKAVSSGSNTVAASSASSSDHGGTPGHYWAAVQLKELDRTSGQKWIAHKHSDGTYSIKNVATGIYLSVRDGKMENGQEVWAYSWNNTKSQRFFIDLDESGEIASEAHIRCYYDKNKVVEVQSGSHADGARIQIYNDNDTYAQKWTFLPTGHEEEYYIINFGSGKALDVKYK